MLTSSSTAIDRQECPADGGLCHGSPRAGGTPHGPAWRDTAAVATGIAGAGDGPFVGRDTALATVTAHISAARAGSGGLVLVSGPAGIGKTRLIEEAVGAGPAVVWGRCVDDLGAPPLWPWHRVLHGRPDVAAAVAAALPDTDPARGPTADPEAAGFRFVAAAAESLVRTANPDGLVLVLEDLHWADETSLRLLRHLAGELHRSRLLVIASYRDPRGTAREDPLDRVLPELVRHPSTHTVVLGPLREDDVHAYLAGAAPTAAAGARRLHRRSGGNPLFLRVLARQERSGSADGTASGR